MKNSTVIRYLFFLWLLPFLVGACSQPAKELTTEESVNFAKEMENSIKRGEGEFIDNAFDKTTFLERMKLPSTDEAEGYGKGVMKKLNLGKTISSSLSDQDNYEFIKHYTRDGKHHLIFRLFSPKQSTLNYHDYELLRAGDKCRIADVYVYLSGETLSETMGNMFRMLFNNNNGSGHNAAEDANDLKEIRGLIQKGRSAEAKKKYDLLPAYVKKAKAVLLLNVLICSNLSNNEYSEAINDLQVKYPNEPNMYLMMVDGYFLQKEYVKMLAAVNSLDSQINKDPLLDFYRYLSYKLLLDNTKAKICLVRLLKNMPDFQRGYQELIAVELGDKNKNEADSLVKIYRGKAKFNQGELDNIISYYRR